ncbi:MAG: GNAT family N-acetyltransferase [Candidatus Eisenbacteria bacterium]|uniref:GNAT family N-acetyltransferase n=1 Tax=Eiseniibacteriota bacterium TaxID=2212470 RepID=A0A948S070_UNCEI|nr:GNAT family N-acetyltransferase [Candidatus Eisenbacteria bacterium]MBU1947446.1 GNAT family N-acetyltransferase [Candidatus Eisenbacteria bacterium]MBU2692427.1 GNAT family N-acetyltransferase [Candidatus Eisenbacteria bacterium]
MKLFQRLYQHEDDYWRIREFLRRVFILNNRRELCWQAYRFDYWRWHGSENMGHGRLERDVFLWEEKNGQIGAVLTREGPGNVALQIRPDLRSPGLVEEMIMTAEGHLSIAGPENQRKLHIWTPGTDNLQKGILRQRGYTKGDMQEFQRRRPLSEPIPDPPVAKGYAIRSLGDSGELPARSLVSWRAFHPEEPEELFAGWDWYYNIQRAPLYRRDLDIVAVAPDGALASFCTIWFDDVTRTGAFEPVGTAPEHQKRGLGKAVMCEGLRRLERFGATMAYVGSYTPAAHALYASIGFNDYDLSEPWMRVF